MNNIDTKHYENLIEELKTNRENMYEILDRICEYRNNINKTFKTEEKDFRIKTGRKNTAASDKVEIAVNIINTELNVRKSIEASIKSENELRRKLDDLDLDREHTEFTFSELQELAKKVENSISNDKKNMLKFNVK